jgi:hypothetical protein
MRGFKRLGGAVLLLVASLCSALLAAAAVGATKEKKPDLSVVAAKATSSPVTGPIVQTDNLVSTGGAATWTSQNFPISLSGTHELFLVFRSVTGGQTGGNLFNLNWLEFQGAGVGT